MRRVEAAPAWTSGFCRGDSISQRRQARASIGVCDSGRVSIMPMSETAKHRHLTIRYCQGCGLDLGSGGDPIVPWAISVDLPAEEGYGTDFGGEVELRGDALRALPWFRD